jgi:hypothetical protein
MSKPRGQRLPRRSKSTVINSQPPERLVALAGLRFKNGRKYCFVAFFFAAVVALSAYDATGPQYDNMQLRLNFSGTAVEAQSTRQSSSCQ